MLAALAAVVPAVPQTSSNAPTANLKPPIDFHSKDGQLYANGELFIIKGANWYGAEGPGDLPEGLSGQFAHSMDHYMQLLADAKFNALRVAFNHQAVLESKPVLHFDASAEPLLVGKRYVESLVLVARAAAKHNIIVTFVAGRLTPEDVPGNGLWYSEKVPEDEVLHSWTQMARGLCSQWNVFAVDLFDEPHGTTWAGSDRSVNWHAAAQRIGNHIQTLCPHWMVMVQGARQSSWESGSFYEMTPGENLMGVHEAPVRLTDQSKLIYAPHVAPPSEHMIDAYNADDFPGNMAAVWGRRFGFVTQLTGKALVVGRFGGLLADDKDARWQQAMLAWLKNGAKSGFFYDCLNANPTSGGLVHKDWSTLRAEKVKLLDTAVPGTAIDTCASHVFHASAPSDPPPRAPSTPPTLAPCSPLRLDVAGHRLPPSPPLGTRAAIPSYRASVARPPPPPASNELVCLSSMRGYNLRGALDWATARTPSTTILSVYTQHWGSLLAEAEAPGADHAIKHLAKGDRLEVAFNHTLCFAAEVADRYNLCFEIVDLTDLEHVRFENRGCGTLEQSGAEQTVALNDAATLHVTARFAPLNERLLGGDNLHLALWVPLGILVILLVGLAALCSRRREVAYRFPAAASALAQARDRVAKRLIRLADDMHMPGVAAWLSRAAAGQHAPLARQTRDGSQISLEMQMSSWEEEGLETPDSRSGATRFPDSGLRSSDAPESRGRATRAALDRVRVAPMAAADGTAQKAQPAPALPPAQPAAAPAEPASELLNSIGDILSQSDLLNPGQSDEPLAAAFASAPPKLSPPPASAELPSQDSWSDIGASQRASREPAPPSEAIAESDDGGDDDDAMSGLTTGPLHGGGASQHVSAANQAPPRPRRPTKRADMVNSLD